MDTALATGLSLFVVCVAVALAAWQWADLRRRSPQNSPEDAAHFHRQDVRRWLVSGLMLLLGVLFYSGTHVATRIGRRPNVVFVETWVAVLGVIIALLVLAAIDWLATTRYARRHRQEIVREGMEILRDELRRRASLRHTAHPNRSAASDQDGFESPTDD